MPFWKPFKVPRSRVLEDKTRKNGNRHAIFTVKGNVYRGEWKYDQRDGKGVYLSKKTNRLYEGEWKNGMKSGYGVMSILLDDGTRALDIEGTWLMGKPEGKVKKHYSLRSNEAFSDGQIKKDCHKLSCREAYFEGEMKGGKRHGHGRMWYADGSFYEGSWKADMRDGLGLFVEVNGNRYEGEWKKNNKHGYGQFFHLHTGQMQYGLWNHGIPFCSVMKDIQFRQACECPTPYPIPKIGIQDPQKLYEKEFYHFVKQQEKIKHTRKKNIC